ncbi:FG-GAP repeat domain-containing protein [Nonomuraea sp. NPDC050663]|uniref:FG-GAP repeat domain-containing protein n=1 Tax=Nonomuraea sp. NPDC050663 TaxID=3364370 RepID=UPI0037B679B0
MRIASVRRAAAAVAVIAAAIVASPSAANAATPTGYEFAGVTDWDGDGHQDIVARDAGGLLWLYPGESTRAYSTQGRYQIGNGWSLYNFTGLADWDLDGHQDIVTLMHYFSPLWLFPGESSRAYSGQPRTQIGHRQGVTYSGVSDWDADGRQDVIVRNPGGELWFHAGSGARTNTVFIGVPGQGARIGNGWNGYTIAGLADWDGDGHQDIVAADPGGVLWLYPGESVQGYSGQQRVQIGTGW